MFETTSNIMTQSKLQELARYHFSGAGERDMELVRIINRLRYRRWATIEQRINFEMSKDARTVGSSDFLARHISIKNRMSIEAELRNQKSYVVICGQAVEAWA